MEAKAILVILLPLIALVLILIWCLLLVRSGRPLDLKISGLGVKLEFHSERKEVINGQHESN